MNVIIFGAKGQLGQCLADIVPSSICAEFLDREDCDLLQPNSIKKILDTKNPDFIINAAAYTAVRSGPAVPGDVRTAAIARNYWRKTQLWAKQRQS